MIPHKEREDFIQWFAMVMIMAAVAIFVIWLGLEIGFYLSDPIEVFR